MHSTSMRSWCGAVVGLLLSAAPVNAAWLPDGNAICRIAGDQAPPVGISSFFCPTGPCSGSLGLYWLDQRNGSQAIYSGSISDYGAPPETPGDVPATLVRASDGQIQPWAAVPVPFTHSGAQFSFSATVLVWTETPAGSAPVIRARRSVEGFDWGPDGVQVSLSSPGPLGVTAVPDDSGGVIVAWQSNTALSRLVFAQRIDRDGQRRWGDNGVLVGSDTTVQTSPSLTRDGAGGAYLLRHDRRGGTGALALFHLDRDGILVPGWPATGVVVGPSYAQIHALRSSWDGTAWVAWMQIVDVPPAPLSEASTPFVTRVLADGAFAAGWDAGGTAVASNRPGLCRMEDLSTTAVGDLVMSLEYRPAFGLPAPTGGDVLVQRMSKTGGVSPGWPAEGLAVCSAPGDQKQSRLFAQGDGAFIAWSDARDDNGDIYAVRVRADGSRPVEWPIDGLRISGASGMQYMPVIAPNAVGGALIAWLDQRDHATNLNDLYGNTVSSDARLDAEEARPQRFRVVGVSPNPARSATRIQFDLTEGGEVQLDILDIAGRRVHGERAALPSGRHSLSWRLGDASGARVAPGVYLARIRTAGHEGHARVLVTR